MSRYSALGDRVPLGRSAMRLMRTVIAMTAAAALALVGCSDDNGSEQRSGSEPEALSAESFVDLLAAEGLPVQGHVVFSEETDPNELLGRPGQYIGKVAWIDERLADDCFDPERPDADCGGTAEFFGDPDALEARFDYLGEFAGESFLGGFWMWRAGNAVVRVGYGLTPAQAEEFEAILESLAPGQVEMHEP